MLPFYTCNVEVGTSQCVALNRSFLNDLLCMGCVWVMSLQLAKIAMIASVPAIDHPVDLLASRTVGCPLCFTLPRYPVPRASKRTCLVVDVFKESPDDDASTVFALRMASASELRLCGQQVFFDGVFMFLLRRAVPISSTNLMKQCRIQFVLHRQNGLLAALPCCLGLETCGSNGHQQHLPHVGTCQQISTLAKKTRIDH